MMVASSRGFAAIGLASTMAALDARSPWLGSRGGSTMAWPSAATAAGPEAAAPRLGDPADALGKVVENVGCWGWPPPGAWRSRRAVEQFQRRVKRRHGLTQTRIDAEQAAIFRDGVTIGHAGDEISCRAGPRRLASGVLADARRRAWRRYPQRTDRTGAPPHALPAPSRPPRVDGDRTSR